MISNFLRRLWASNTMLNLALMPFSLMYLAITILRKTLARPKRVEAFVICVGSRYVGGAGKTPIAISIAKLFHNHKVAFISRGYGGSLSTNKPLQVNPKKHSYLEVGDEPLLLAKVAPTFICKNRYNAAALACKKGYNLLILDDGLQHYTLHYDMQIAVENSNSYNNGLPLPAGPLREISLFSHFVADYATNVNIHIVSAPKPGPAIAFCGLANPSKFEATIIRLGFDLLDFHEYPDHYEYEDHEFQDLIHQAAKLNAMILTTAKDYVKIPNYLQQHFSVIEIEAILDDEFTNELQRFLADHRS